MKFLITNDDGIHAPGLAALEVIVVAPEICNSSCGHQTTTSRPLKLRKLDDLHYAVNGTPADCVRLAVLNVAPEIDWILSGVNSGGNLGVDIYMSGTVAAVREGMLLGKKGIAFSQYRKGRKFLGWNKALQMSNAVLRTLLARGCEEKSYWNVNFPDEPGETLPKLKDCPIDPHPLPFAFDPIEEEYHYRSNYHERPALPNHDVDVCFSGNIAISQARHVIG
jgi:5'-nucleotidase